MIQVFTPRDLYSTPHYLYATPMKCIHSDTAADFSLEANETNAEPDVFFSPLIIIFHHLRGGVGKGKVVPKVAIVA
jgi:hypothetical protein